MKEIEKNKEDRQQYRAQYYLSGEHTAQGTHHLILARGENSLYSALRRADITFSHIFPKTYISPQSFLLLFLRSEA